MTLFDCRRVPALVPGLAACFGSLALAQDQVPDTVLFGVPAERFFELIDDEEASSNVAETLAWLHENPIDLNSAQREDLLLIPGVTGEDADAILRAREREGQFASVEAIQCIPGGKELLAGIRPYLFVQHTDAGRAGNRIPAAIVSWRLSGLLPGAATPSDPDMLGSLTRSLSRVALRLSEHVKAGVLFEKDAGERVRDGFLSGYFSFHGNGPIEQVVIGDFTAEAGQGLVLWRGADGGRNGDLVGGIHKSGARLVPYHLADEAHYLRGGAVALKSKFSAVTVRCLLLVSRTPLAASVNDQGEVTSFYSSGLYRTAAEMEKRSRVHEFLAGTRFECGVRGKGTIGLTYYRSVFDRGVKPGSHFGFTGEKSEVAGGDFNITLGGAALFGEIARSVEGGTAWTAGAVMPLDSTARVSISYRDYSMHFNNPHARAYGVQANTTNERGIAIGWSVRLARAIVLHGYADQCKIPGSTYTSLLPHTANDFLVEVTALPIPECASLWLSVCATRKSCRRARGLLQVLQVFRGIETGRVQDSLP